MHEDNGKPVFLLFDTMICKLPSDFNHHSFCTIIRSSTVPTFHNKHISLTLPSTPKQTHLFNPALHTKTNTSL